MNHSTSNNGTGATAPRQEPTDDSEFHFKSDVDMNAVTKQIGESMAATIGCDPSQIKCKGIRIFYVTDGDMLVSSGLFVKGFSPEDWD